MTHPPPNSLSDGQVLAGLLLVVLLAVLGSKAKLVRLQRALGVEQLLASGFLFLPLGMLLSDAGLGILTQAVAHELDVLVSLGLGVLGLLLGLRLDGRSGAKDGTLVARAAAVESLFTLVLVGLPTFVLLDIASPLATGQRAAAAALLGCAAAISGIHPLKVASRRDRSRPGAVARIADLGTVCAVLAAGALLAVLNPAGTIAPLERLLALAGIGMGGGLAAWLLASDTKEGAQRTALLLGIVLVTAGTAAHLKLPPVAATLLTGITIAHLPGTLARELREGLAFLETPFTVLLLVIGGAALPMPTAPALVVLLVFLVLRTAGKILGGKVASALSRGALPERMGLGLLPSSAVALGLALDFQATAQGEIASTVVFTAVLGSLLSETAGIWTTRMFTQAQVLSEAALAAATSAATNAAQASEAALAEASDAARAAREVAGAALAVATEAARLASGNGTGAETEAVADKAAGESGL